MPTLTEVGVSAEAKRRYEIEALRLSRSALYGISLTDFIQHCMGESALSIDRDLDELQMDHSETIAQPFRAKHHCHHERQCAGYGDEFRSVHELLTTALRFRRAIRPCRKRDDARRGFSRTIAIQRDRCTGNQAPGDERGSHWVMLCELAHGRAAHEQWQENKTSDLFHLAFPLKLSRECIASQAGRCDGLRTAQMN